MLKDLRPDHPPAPPARPGTFQPYPQQASQVKNRERWYSNANSNRYCNNCYYHYYITTNTNNNNNTTKREKKTKSIRKWMNDYKR